MLADAFDNDTDEMSDVVLAERSAGERREHGLAIDAEQDERHEIGVIILANDALLLAKDENVSNKPLKRSTVGRWFADAHLSDATEQSCGPGLSSVPELSSGEETTP